MKISMTPEQFNIVELTRELEAHPEIWNEIPHRTYDSSPHREVDDIWVRYNSYSNWRGDGNEFNGPHTSVWYPVVEKIPSARLLSLDLLARMEGERLGGVLITRIPPGMQVYPHIDQGWHARFYEKFIVQIKGNEKQEFCFEGERLSAQPGQCYWFDNSYLHWVKNESDEERISLIVCVRREKCH